jgi:2-octaprenyl-6-methoxyphenol hydroxylase
VSLRLTDGRQMRFAGLIAADGRNSPARAAAGIATRETSLPQSALVCAFAHSRPHADMSNEIHTETGPCTTVPLPGGRRSSLVWVLKPEDAEAKAALPLDELSARIEERMQSMLGAVTVDAEAGVQVWPLGGVLASKAAAGHIALIGEAAHRFPPIGAQGLNLSVRDVAELVETLSKNDGVTTAFGFYASARASDIRMRYASVMTLNRTLLSDLLPAQMARGIGLGLLDTLPGLRGFVMREGLEPGSGWRRFRPGARAPQDRSQSEQA